MKLPVWKLAISKERAISKLKVKVGWCDFVWMNYYVFATSSVSCCYQCPGPKGNCVLRRNNIRSKYYQNYSQSSIEDTDFIMPLMRQNTFYKDKPSWVVWKFWLHWYLWTILFKYKSIYICIYTIYLIEIYCPPVLTPSFTNYPYLEIGYQKYN